MNSLLRVFLTHKTLGLRVSPPRFYCNSSFKVAITWRRIRLEDIIGIYLLWVTSVPSLGFQWRVEICMNGLKRQAGVLLGIEIQRLPLKCCRSGSLHGEP